MKILQAEGIIGTDIESYQHIALQDYFKIKKKSLQSHGHTSVHCLSDITNTLSILTRYLITAYLFIGIMFVFFNNDVPIPIFNPSNENTFYVYVIIVFLTMTPISLFTRYFMRKG